MRVSARDGRLSVSYSFVNRTGLPLLVALTLGIAAFMTAAGTHFPFALAQSALLVGLVAVVNYARTVKLVRAWIVITLS
jgi:hypothetical protein